MAVEQVEGIPVTVAQAQEIDWLARDLRRDNPSMSEADSIEASCAAFECGHKPDVGPIGPIWADLSPDDSEEEAQFAEEAQA